LKPTKADALQYSNESVEETRRKWTEEKEIAHSYLQIHQQ